MSTDFKWSKYQEDIFNAALTTNKNIVVNAKAGSAKTSSLVEISKRLKNSIGF